MNNFSIIRYPSKSAGVPTLAKFFKERQYRTSFYYGGETEFANIKSYLLQSSFDRLTDKNAFESKDLNSKWGAHDGAVAARISNDLQKEQAPFFVSWLTLSSHEPFETPIETYFKGEDHLSKFSNAMHYADGVIYDFVQQCSRQPWWQNTLLIIVADHGHHAIPPSTTIDNFEIPMLWLGGALKQQGLVIDKFCSQIDLATTLTAQLGGSASTFKFSKNILDSTSKPWAYFSFNNGFGFAQPQGTFVFDNIGKQVIQQRGTITKQDIDAGKSMQQRTYQDYIDR
jgi:phosphoglycerol transferase MdoB-like AlkP superfamily enzyme